MRASSALTRPTGGSFALDAEIDSLRRSEARYRTLIDAVALDVFRTDPRGNLLTDMPGWCSVTGVDRDVLGLAWLADVHPDDRERVRTQWLDHCVPTGTPFEGEYRLRVADGTERVLMVRAVPVRDVDGSILEWIGTSVDVTEERTAGRRMVLLQRVTAELAGAVVVDDVLASVLRLAREELGATGAGVFLRDEAGTTLELCRVEGYESLSDRWNRIPLASDRVVARVARLGAPVLAGDREEAEHLSGGERLGGIQAYAVLPLTTTGAPLGALGLAWYVPRTFSSADRELLLALASQVAQAVERARLFEQQSSIARILQQALLPDRLPVLPGLEVAARYLPAAGSDVGGDWYDVLPLRDDRVALVLGDVMGRGVRAASRMGQVRNMLRGIAAVDPEPSAVLRGLDTVFAQFDPDEITTVVYSLLDLRSGSLHVGNAGHLPPLLVRVDGRSGLLDDGASTPLGVPVTRAGCKGTVLHAGDVLVVCSDGLVERRDRPDGAGLARLEQVARGWHDRGAPLDALADELLSALLDGDAVDDVSMLLARLAPTD